MKISCTILYSQQIGVLAFLNGGEEGKTLYNAFVAGQVCYEVYKRLTVSQADVLRVRVLIKSASLHIQSDLCHFDNSHHNWKSGTPGNT